jgi:tetratricopeptide (TPR) repeat protein
MHQGNNDAIKTAVGESCEEFKSVLSLNSDCTQSLLYLIDIYGNLPEEMGGDKSKAEEYLRKLSSLDPFCSALGEQILNQNALDGVKFWESYLEKYTDNEKAREQLGYAYFEKGEIEKGKEQLELVINKNPEQQHLLLQVARAYMYKVMSGSENPEDLNKLTQYIQTYLATAEAEPVCLEVWCYGVLANVAMFSGDEKLANDYTQKATALTPYFSRASALPKLDTPPNELAYSYSSFFKPF